MALALALPPPLLSPTLSLPSQSLWRARRFMTDVLPVALSLLLAGLVAGIVAPASALFFKTFISRKKADRAN